MKTQKIVEVITIKGIQEIKHFDIQIPENTYQLVGIEYGIRFNEAIVLQDTIQYDRNFLAQMQVADIRLEGAINHTWFYAQSLKDSLQPIDMHDFYTENSLMNIPFEFLGKRNKETLVITPTSTRIKGFVKDVIGSTLQQSIPYSITICLHIELQN
jgi:hypothetical protein